MDQSVPEPPSVERRSPSAVALVGFMGAGKTSVGQELAVRLGWRFFDLDVLIEQRERRTIADIFRQQGEPAFRRLELSLLRELVEASTRGPRVLALGGGAFVQPGVQKCLQEASIPAAFLDAPTGELFRRCEQPGLARPLRRDPEQFRELYERRRPEYLKAAICVETTGKTIGAVAEEIIAGLSLVPASGACD